MSSRTTEHCRGAPRRPLLRPSRIIGEVGKVLGLEDLRAIAFEVVCELKTTTVRDRLRELRLSLFERPIAQVFPINFEQIEGIEENLVIVHSALELVEIGYPKVSAAPNRFPDDERGTGLKAAHGFDDARIAVAPVTSSTGKEAHTVAGDKPSSDSRRA